jgi:hypothetical protein
MGLPISVQIRLEARTAIGGNTAVSRQGVLQWTLRGATRRADESKVLNDFDVIVEVANSQG